MRPQGSARRSFLTTCLLASAGCTLAPDANHDGPDAPRAEPLARPVRTAWVFSSGGPRGFVHVGVLRALDELGLRPDLLVGASVGALVSVLYASGLSARDVEAQALELGTLDMGRLAFFADGGERFSGAPIAEFVRQQLRGRRLEQLPLAVACVAATPAGAPLAFTAGDAGLAVQASAAVPGRFTPVRIRGMAYLDADPVAPLPVRLARSLGARRVLAVDASAHEDRAPEGAERFRAGDLQKRALTRPDAQAADVLLHPDFGYWVNLSREFRLRAMRAGYEATLARAAELKALHAG
jgi:NTE family protein